MRIVRMVLSVASMLIGVIIITGSKLVGEFTAKLGFAAFQAAAAGSYSPENYELDLSLNYWFGSLCIIIGAVFALLGPLKWCFDQIKKEASIKSYVEQVKTLNKEYDQQNKDV